MPETWGPEVVPHSLEEFDSAAVAGTWLLNDSLPTVAQEFAFPPSSWDLNYYGGISTMLFPATVITMAVNRIYMTRQAVNRSSTY